MISFVDTKKPCVTTTHILWHLEHGDVRDVVTSDGRRIAVVYFTTLPGTGLVIHFDTPEDVSVSRGDIRDAFCRMAELLEDVPLVLSTVSIQKRSLLKLLRRLGFRIIVIYNDPDGGYALLQFIKRRKKYIR